MRVLVCGGRNYCNIAEVFYALDLLQPSVVIEGGASGADALARRYAVKRGVAILTFEADWRKHGRAAGPIRNGLMLVAGKPDLGPRIPRRQGHREHDQPSRESWRACQARRLTPPPQLKGTSMSQAGQKLIASATGAVEALKRVKPEDSRAPHKGWAPGGYLCLCRGCDEHFIGDKRAFQCADCAYVENHS